MQTNADTWKLVVIVCISQSSPFPLSSHPAAARLSSFLAAAQKIRDELKGSHPSAYLEMLLCLSCMENMFWFLLADTHFVFPPAALSPGTGEFLHSLPVSPVRLLPLQVLPYAPYVREASVSRLQFLLSASAYLLCTTLPFLRTENRQPAWYDFFFESLKAISSIMYTQMDVIDAA